MKSKKDNSFCRAIVVVVSFVVLANLPTSASPTIAPDGARNSSEMAYISLPSFAACRADSGVAIHDISDTALLDAVKDVGFSFVRTDLFWEAVQAADGRDYATFDRLVSNLKARGLGALFILGYKHYLFSPDQPPTAPAQLAAFSAYVSASVLHYQRVPVRFEVWNEQDHKDYWLAEPSPFAYRNLLKTAVKAAKAANPNVVIATGGVQQVDRKFIREVGDISATQAGPDAVSVHPYRQEYPETVFADYRALREDLSSYRKVPAVWATEWSYPSFGYKYVSAIADGHSQKARERQAKYAVRRFLVDWIAQVGLTAYYDMRNDGTDPSNMEHNFGLLDTDNTKLPAYNATKHLFAFTADVTSARYFIDTKEQYVVIKLNKAGATKYVIWCYGDGNTLQVDLSLLPGAASVTDLYGAALTKRGVLTVTEAQGPVFISVPPS
jgi:hypothetical protein